MQHAGIILAAGASTRMGEPKALLRMPSGVPLVQQQISSLKAAGYDPVIVVLGANADIIEPKLSDCRIVLNVEWEKGRLSSVQAGLKAVDADGYLILPVDTVGVSAKTLDAVAEHAEKMTPLGVRPTYNGQPGKVAWISSSVAKEILEMPCTHRLDDILRTPAIELPVDDPAILNNINTREDWQRVLGVLR